MNKLEWIKKQFNLHTLSKKIMLISKIIAVVIIVFYIIISEQPSNSTASIVLLLTLVIVVVLLMDYLLGKIVTKPIVHINDTAEKMSKLDFSKTCNIHSHDEFETLSNSLNTMSSNLQQALNNLEKVNNQLEKDVQCKHLLLTQRKELVDNLSHEMKTPLGVIRAYAEGILDETDSEKRTNYTHIIIEETEQMNKMISSLLDLSALEAGAVKLSKQRFDIVELVETVAGRLLIDSPDVNFHLSYYLPEKKLFVNADKGRMEQVLNNLISNAKKYVISNGELKLSIKQEGQTVRFSIFNQGLQISEEDLQKIWTKFYRRGETKNKSGSGLGLAITAQILEMQDMKYGVLNKDKGVEFYFYIPIDN